MANAMPWSVRGIDPDIREQAVEAAHRSGLSVGQWLNQVLSGSLDDERDDEPPAAKLRAPQRRMRKVEDLDQRLARIGRGRTETRADSYREDEGENGQHRMMGLLEQAISAIERLEQGNARPAAIPYAVAHAPVAQPMAVAQPRDTELLDAFRWLEQRVQMLAQQAQPKPAPSQRAARGMSPRHAEDDPAFASAIAEIEARRRELDASAQPQSARAGRPAAPFLRRQEEAPRVETTRHFDDMRQQLDQLVGRIDDMRREHKPEAARLQDRMDSLAQRIEEWRQKPSEDVALIRRDLASLSVAIEQLSPNRLVGMVENAMQAIAEKALRAPRDPMPERIVDALGEMQDDLHAVMKAVAQSRGSDRVAEEIGLVARRLEEIGARSPDLTRIDDIMRETDAIKSLIGQAMRAQPLEGLAHQIEALGKEIERFARQPAPVRDDKPVIDAIREVRDRVERIDPAQTFKGIEQRLSAIALIEERLGALAGLEEKIDTIARDVSRIAKDAKPLPQLDSIAERLERIDKVLDGTRTEPLAGLTELAEKLDRIGSSLEKVSEPKNEPLVGMLEQLAARIDAVQSSRSDATALDALQEDIARIGSRLDELSPGAPGQDGIERNVSDLIAQFDLARQDIRKSASEAAEKAARDAIKSIARDETGDTLAAEGLLLLKRDLGEFKSQQGESERRTRQMLEALHGTLEAVATRLGQIETARIETARMEASRSAVADVPAQRIKPQMTAEVAKQAAPAPEKREPAPPSQPSPAQAQAAARPQPQASSLAPQGVGRGSQAEAEDDFSDLPLEPGMQPGDIRPGAGEPGMSADPRTNFIAAARRAAQAAAQQSQDAMAAAEMEKKSKGIGAMLKGMLSKGAKPEATPAAMSAAEVVARPRRENGIKTAQVTAAKAEGSFLARQRRPILLGLAALIFALGALKVLTSSGTAPSPDIAPPLPPVTQERSLPQSAPADTPAPRVEQRSEAKPRAVDPIQTSSLPPPVVATTPNGQQVVIPTLNQPQPANAKRAQRLGETSAISQADPITVGSITPDGAAKPIETGRDALSELANQSNLKGSEKLREAALAGNAAAMFEVGARHADGRGMPRDAKLAARWFEQAAAMGHGPSQYRLASLYREGRGVPKDPAIAFQWFDRAAAQGHVLAMHNAAVLLAEGVHGAPDYAGAALWFKRAAEHGVKDSQFNVAILFARGLGVNQDLVESYRWFSAAAAQGDQDAIKKREDIGARLTKEQLAKERDWVKTFTPMKANPAANDAGNWEVAGRSAQPATQAQNQRQTRTN